MTREEAIKEWVMPAIMLTWDKKRRDEIIKALEQQSKWIPVSERLPESAFGCLVTVYDDEHEEFTEKKMSIIAYINAYTDEGVTTADDILDRIRAEIDGATMPKNRMSFFRDGINCALQIIDKYRKEQE